MLPTRRFILLLAGAAPLIAAGALYAPLLLVAGLYLAALIMWMLAEILLLPRKRRIEVARLVPERVSHGHPTEIIYEVATSFRRRASVRIAEDLPPHLAMEPDIVSAVFQPGGKARLEARLTANRRGLHELKAVDVRIRPRGGLFYRQFRLPMPADVHVYPNLVNIQRYELRLRRGLAREGRIQQRRIGEGTEFESLRPYAPGDEPAHIDWKATAKRGRLIVKNRQPECQQSVLVTLDTGRATAATFGGISRLDYFVNATMMLAYVALRQGDRFSLVTFSDRIESYLPPITQLQNVDRVAQALYRVETRLVESDYAAACHFLGLKSRKRSLVCLMTDVIDRQANASIISYMAHFSRRHLPLAILLADSELQRVARAPLAQTDDLHSKAVALDVLAAREEALQTMRQSGVSVLEARPNQLVTDVVDRYLTIKARHRL